MELKELILNIENKINEKIVEFESLGRQAKEIQEKMHLIALELEPVKYIIEKHNSKYIELFDALLELHGKKLNE